MSAAKAKPPPQSCDTFVVIAGDGVDHTVFGKNSDRPSTEAHEVVRFPRAKNADGCVLQCQYLKIPQVPETHAIILSRPAWLWGAEMGANEYGVCVGNEAVNSRLASECDDGVARLLGMDLVRLGLERGKTAREAVEAMTSLLEEFGQGGSCEEGGDWCYENGFLIADTKEAFILETAGTEYWATELIGKGQRRNISNGLSIREPYMTHPKLLDLCKAKKWWDGVSAFDWKVAIGGGGVASANLEPDGREKAGKEWLEKMPAAPGFEDMALCLRDTDSGICMQGYFESTGSQISLLQTTNVSSSVHWFTTGSDPSKVCYKPFSFAADGGVGAADKTGEAVNLWRSHKKVSEENAKSKHEHMMALEAQLLEQVSTQGGIASPEDFLRAVEAERQLLNN